MHSCTARFQEAYLIDSDLVKWIAGIILVLRIVLGFPVSAKGWKRWMGKKKVKGTS